MFRLIINYTFAIRNKYNHKVYFNGCDLSNIIRLMYTQMLFVFYIFLHDKLRNFARSEYFIIANRLKIEDPVKKF